MSKILDKLLHYSPYISGLVTFVIFAAFKQTLQNQLKLVSIALESIINIILSRVLKHLFKQPRPNSKEYGFPSAHSMFWAGYGVAVYIGWGTSL